MIDLFFQLLALLWNGLMMIGRALWGLINLPLNALGINMPTWIIQIATIIGFIIIVFKFGKSMSRIILIALLITFAVMLLTAIF